MTTEQEKIKNMNIISVSDLSNEQIDVLYKHFLKNKKVVHKKNPNVNVDKDSEKYKVALKFVNELLKNMGKNTFGDLTEFTNMDRLNIVTDTNSQTLEKMEKDIFMHFDKLKCGYYSKGKNWIMNVLRGLIRDLGLNWKSVHKNIQKNSVAYTHSFYSIE